MIRSRRVWNTSAELLTSTATRPVPKGASQVAVFSDTQVVVDVLGGGSPTARYIVNPSTPISIDLGIQASEVRVTSPGATKTYLNFFVLNPNFRVGSLGNQVVLEGNFLNTGDGRIDAGDGSLLLSL